MKRLPLIATLCLLASCSHSQPLTRDHNAEQEIKMYLAANFGNKGYEPLWYKNDTIKDIEVRGDTVTVKVNFDSSVAKNDICSAVSGYVFSAESAGRSLRVIRVIGNSGQVLLERNGQHDRCSEE